MWKDFSIIAVQLKRFECKKKKRLSVILTDNSFNVV